MAETDETPNASLWDAFPKGVILSWYGSGDLPKELQGKWAFCDGLSGRPNLNDGRFLRGVGSLDFDNQSKNYGGTVEHTHIVDTFGAKVDHGFRRDPEENELGKTTLAKHIPPYLNVRFIIKI